MHNFDLAIGAQSLGAWRQRFLVGPGVAVAAIYQPTRELLVSLNEAGH